MKILIISQYFWPENFKINDLCIGLKERGHEVTVLTGIPNYPKGVYFKGYRFWKNNDEDWNGIKIYRSKLLPRGKSGIKLMLNYISFIIFGCLKAIFVKGKFDKILVYQLSPVTVGIPAIFISKLKKVPYYFWVQDLWPESLKVVGGINNKLVLSILNKITLLMYNKSKKVLVQSRAFINYITAQGIPEDKIIYYPNSTENFFKPLEPSKEYISKVPQAGFKLMFAGNLGEAQSIDTLIKAAIIIKAKNINVQWIFLGDGRYKENIVSEIKLNKLEDNIHLLGSFPSECMPDFFACSDALLVSLKKDKIFSLTIPSKVQSYMACGKPILASLDGEGARIIEESQCGYTSPAENAESLAENVVRLYRLSVTERAKMGENAVRYFQTEFERELLLDKLVQIFEN